MQNRPIVRFAILAVLAIFVGVYRYTHKNASGSGTSSTINSSQKTSDDDLKLPDSDRAMRAKLEPAIDCLNQQLAHFESLESGYHSSLKELMAPPSSDAFHHVGMPSFQDRFFAYDRSVAPVQECATTLDKAASTSPSLPDFDAAAREDAADMRAIVDPGQQMDSYLEQKAYVDDHFAKARTLDATLSPLLAKMNHATGQLREALRRENTAMDHRRLDALEKANGRTLPWQTQRAMLAARFLDEQMKADLRANKLDANAAAAAIQPLQTAVDEAQAYVRSHPGVEKANSNGFQALWFSMNSLFDSELARGRDVKIFLQTPPGPNATPQEQREKLYREVRSVNDDFNELISMYNEQIQIRKPLVAPPSPGQ